MMSRTVSVLLCFCLAAVGTALAVDTSMVGVSNDGGSASPLPAKADGAAPADGTVPQPKVAMVTAASGDNCAILWDSYTFTGNAYILAKNSQVNFAGAGADAMSSVTVANGCTLVLYYNYNFASPSWTFSPASADAVWSVAPNGQQWDNNSRSAKCSC